MRRLFRDMGHLWPASESGISLVELLVGITLLTIAIAAVTGVLSMSLRAQDTVNAGLRSQLDTRKVLYDMEVEVSEAKRSAATGQYAVFQNDLVCVPTQEGGWVTYEYVTPPGESSSTIVRHYSATMPSLPVTPVTNDAVLINPGRSEITTTVDRSAPGAPIFKYFDKSGVQISAPVSNPRNVRSIRVEFAVTESKGHEQGTTNLASTQINLRNY